jgi:hypothetical protein
LDLDRDPTAAVWSAKKEEGMTGNISSDRDLVFRPVGARGPSSNPGAGYDQDLCAWATHQAALLRAGRVHEADLANIAEEVEDLCKRDRHELASRVRTVLWHLMKLRASAVRLPRSGWRAIIEEQRTEIERVLADSPSLRRELAAVIVRETKAARQLAAADLEEQGEPAEGVEGLVFSVADVIG